MDFNAKDVNADKVKFHEGARRRLAAIYKKDLSFFGPEKTVSYPFSGRDDSLLSVDEQVAKEKWEKQFLIVIFHQLIVVHHQHHVDQNHPHLQLVKIKYSTTVIVDTNPQTLMQKMRNF